MRIRRLTLQTLDLPALTDFYVRQLGLRVLERNRVSLTLAVGSSALVFRAPPNPVPDTPQPRYHFAFNVPGKSIEAAAAWLGRAAPLLPIPGQAPDQPIAPFPNWQAEAVYALDPGGNIIECIARHGLELPPAGKPFSAADLHSVSEIGVVVEDVPTAVTRYQQSSTLPVFARQPPQPNFAAMGTDTGLLIVVPPGRPWFPTDVPSAAFPLEVEFQYKPGKVALLRNGWFPLF